MKLYPITLGTGRQTQKAKKGKGASSGGGGAVRAAKAPIPIDIKRDVLARDNNTCQCCGFQSEKYQQILFKDFNPNNLDKSNLITTCIFCHQSFDLVHAADMKAGALIWMPELEQYEINNIAKAIYIARIAQGPIAELARNLLDIFMTRRQEATNRITTDNPLILATVLDDYLPVKSYMRAQKKLDGLRLFPLDRRIIKEADLEFNQFPQILAYWRSKGGPFKGVAPAQWVDSYKECLIETAHKLQ